MPTAASKGLLPSEDRKSSARGQSGANEWPEADFDIGCRKAVQGRPRRGRRMRRGLRAADDGRRGIQQRA